MKKKKALSMIQILGKKARVPADKRPMFVSCSVAKNVLPGLRSGVRDLENRHNHNGYGTVLTWLVSYTKCVKRTKKKKAKYSAPT